jgi:hypothetical protein
MNTRDIISQSIKVGHFTKCNALSLDKGTVELGGLEHLRLATDALVAAGMLSQTDQSGLFKEWYDWSRKTSLS